MIRSKILKIIAWVLCCSFPVILGGCDYSTYKIKKGRHYSTHRVALMNSGELKFIALFDDSAMYKTKDPGNQGDINKLYGFSDCSSLHHQNSARFGWRWLNEKLEIHAYTYIGGVRESELIGTADLNKQYEYSLRIEEDEYIFTFDGRQVNMPRGCSSMDVIRYMLWPYFGGDETAPHTITIYLDEI